MSIMTSKMVINEYQNKYIHDSLQKIDITRYARTWSLPRVAFSSSSLKRLPHNMSYNDLLQFIDGIWTPAMRREDEFQDSKANKHWTTFEVAQLNKNLTALTQEVRTRLSGTRLAILDWHIGLRLKYERPPCSLEYALCMRPMHKELLSLAETYARLMVEPTRRALKVTRLRELLSDEQHLAVEGAIVRRVGGLKVVMRDVLPDIPDDVLKLACSYASQQVYAERVKASGLLREMAAKEKELVKARGTP